MPILGALVKRAYELGKLPEIGSALGKGIKNFKKSVSDQGDTTNPPSKKEDDK